MQSFTMDAERSYGFPSVAELSHIQTAFAEYSATHQYSALKHSHESFNATFPLAEKQLAVNLFRESLEWLIGQVNAPVNPAIAQMHVRLEAYQARVARTLAILSREARPAPKVMHFVWVGGSEVGVIQRDYMNIWRAVLAGEEYRFNLWYDSDALLAFEMNRVILDSARVHAMESGGEQITKPGQLAQMIEDRARVLKQQMALYINQPQWAGRHDEARIQLMVSAYGKDRLILEAFRKKCLASHEAMTGQDFRLRDVRKEFADHFLSDVYQREVGMRGNFAAASDVVRLQASDLEGGRYSDMDYLPPLADKLGGVDISAFSDSAKIGLLQLLLNEDDTLMPGRDRHRYDDRIDKIPSEHKAQLLAFAREKPGVSKIFVAPADNQVPHDAMRLGTAFGLASAGEMNAHFITQPRSAMTMAYMQMVRTNYDCIFEIERRLLSAKVTAADDRRILDIVQNVINEKQQEGKFPRSKNNFSLLGVIEAITQYYQDGIRVGARGTIALTGPGAAVAGLMNYIERDFFPDQVDAVRGQLKLSTGYNVFTEEEMISGWTVNGDADEWLAKEQEKWKSGKLKSRFAGNLTELLKGQRITFKQGWPVIEGKLVFLTGVLQQLMNDLGEPFTNAMRDKLSAEIIFDKRIDLGFDQRKQILAQPDSAIPVSVGEQSAGNLNELLTLLAHESVSLDQLSPLQRTVLGGLFDAQRLDAEGFAETWQKVLEVASETADGGFFHRYNTIEKILRKHQTPAFEAGLAHGGAPGSESAGELKVRALAEPMSLYELGQRIAQINSTARRDYLAKILKHAAKIREQLFKEGAISARQIPQDLLRHTSGDPGRRCYPLALLTAAALDLGSEAERALIGRIANASLSPDAAESRLMLSALDELSGIVATEVGRSRGALDLKTLIRNLQAKTSAVYLLDTGKHALLVAKVLVDAKPVYRFFDPNFAIFGFSQIDALQQGIERHLAGDGELSGLYGLAGSNDPMFTVIELDTKAIAAKVLPSNLLVTDLLKSEIVAAGRTVSVWDAQASALVRSLSENVRMGESLAQLDARYWADEFEDAARRLRNDHKLGAEYVPLLETVEETSKNNYTLTLLDAGNPEISVKVSTADLRFAKVGAHLKRLAKNFAGPSQGPAEADGGSRLSFAFAIQAIITEMRSREYQSTTQQIPALSIALQVQAYVSYAQLGFGVVGDSVQIVSLVRQVAAGEKALASGASLAGRLVGRAASAVGFGFSGINIGFDIHGLTLATNEEQRSRLYTQLAFNIAGLGLDIAALAIGGAAGGALAAIAVPVLGVGIGAAAIASNLGQINDKARAVGRHLFLINEAYTAAGHNIEDGVLTFAPEGVITKLDLRRRSVAFDSQRLCRTLFKSVGLPSFDNAPNELHRAINIREALFLPSSLTIAKHKPISALVLPCTPICYYGYEYQLGSSGFSPDDDLLDRLKACQRRLDFGDYPLPVAQDSESLRTSFPNILDSWKQQLEFDAQGEQRLQFFSTAPFPHILYKLLAFNKPTVISVSLNKDCRQLVVPQLPSDWKNLISYEITPHSGQVQLTLAPGLVSVVLNQPPLVDGPYIEAFEPLANVDWVIAATWASEEQVRFEGSVLIVDGIRIEGFQGYLQLRNGELFHRDLINKAWLLVSVSISEPEKDPQSARLLTRLRSLRRNNRLALRHITLHDFPVPLTPSGERVYVTGYYDVALDRVLYARNLPANVLQGAVLGAVAGQHAWFYHPDHPTIWRVDSITGTVNHRYRLMSPKRGARITRFEGTVDGGLHVVQQPKNIEQNSYSLEYLIYEETLTFTRISADSTSEDAPERTLEYWRVPLNRFRQSLPFADGSADMSKSISSWKAAPFIELSCSLHGEFAYSGWLRLHDGKYIFNDFSVTQRTMLMWGQPDIQDAIIYDKQTNALIRVPLNRVEHPEIFGEVFESNVVELIPAAGRYIAVKDDGRMFEVNSERDLRFLGVGKRWFDLNPDWLDALSGLAQKNAVEPFAVMGLPHTDDACAPATWCVAGQLLITPVGDGRELSLLARTPDGKASWLLDVAAGKLYRQALMPFETVRAALVRDSGVLSLRHLPAAQPVWGQWQFSAVESHGQGLLACTREGVNMELRDHQPARVIGVNSQWSFVDEQADGQLRSRLQALVSALPHASVLKVGERDGCYRYFVPQSDQLFEIYGPNDGQWPMFLGVNGSVPLLFDALERCIFSSTYKPTPSVSLLLEDCLAQRDEEVMSIASRSDFSGLAAMRPEGVEKLLLTFGAPKQICHVTDLDWQSIECIVLECRQAEQDQGSTMPVLYLDMSVTEGLLLSVKDGQLVFSDPDNAHSLIVSNAYETVMPMQIHVTVGARGYRLHIEQLLNQVKVAQVDNGYVEMKTLLATNDEISR